MRDFDQERQQRHREREQELGDRSFKLGGETFSYKANVSVDVLRRLTSETLLTGGDYIDMIHDSCLDMIEADNDAHARFSSLLKRTDDPITMDDLQAVFQSLVEEAFKRPTQASSLSGDGDASTGTNSTENSSSEPAEAVAA